MGPGFSILQWDQKNVASMEVVIASSNVDAGIGCWELCSGAEQLCYKSCASPPHGLVCVSGRFLASSQLGEPSAVSGSILYWSWSKPQAEVRSFPAEPIRPIAANSEGTYIVGGGHSGHIYLWEVVTGKLLKKWRAHYRAVTCLVFNEDGSLLISGSEDGGVRVWNLITIFDDQRRTHATQLYLYSFSQHTLCVTDVVIGYGRSNAIIVSASEDRTCKVWSLSRGGLLRNIIFPTIIDAIALDPGEHVFYAGGRDGKIYIAALNADISPSRSFGMYICGVLSDHGKPVTCLAYRSVGDWLLSGSEDGMIRVWDTRTRNIVSMFRHAKGPVNNIVIVKQSLLSPPLIPSLQFSSRRQGSALPPPLSRNVDSTDEGTEYTTVCHLSTTRDEPTAASYFSSELINGQIKELEQWGSAAADMEMERLKLDSQRPMQLAHQWKKMYENLLQFCVNELGDVEQEGITNGNCT